MMVGVVFAYFCGTMLLGIGLTQVWPRRARGGGALTPERAQGWPYWVVGVTAAALLAGTVWIWRQETTNMPTSFACPLVPWVPCAGVLCNSVMVAGLPLTSWVRLAGWSAIGAYPLPALGCERAR